MADNRAVRDTKANAQSVEMFLKEIGYDEQARHVQRLRVGYASAITNSQEMFKINEHLQEENEDLRNQVARLLGKDIG